MTLSTETVAFFDSLIQDSDFELRECKRLPKWIWNHKEFHKSLITKCPAAIRLIPAKHIDSDLVDLVLSIDPSQFTYVPRRLQRSEQIADAIITSVRALERHAWRYIQPILRIEYLSSRVISDDLFWDTLLDGQLTKFLACIHDKPNFNKYAPARVKVLIKMLR